MPAQKFSDLLSFMTGAGFGSLIGSFLVHCVDTLITRKIFIKKNASYSFIKNLKFVLKSYVPVGLWIVPSRAIALGVYGYSQDVFYDHIQSSVYVKILSAIIAGFSLSLISAPAEVIKTKKQLHLKWENFKIYDLYHGITPLFLRVIPTMTFMLAGTEIIQSSLPFPFLKYNIIGVFIAALFSAFISQLIAVPFENLRIYRIMESNAEKKKLKESFKNFIKSHHLYVGYLQRSLVLGIQAGFTLSSAYELQGLTGKSHL